MTQRTPPALAPSPPAARFKPAIEEAIREGVSPSALLLRFTRRDVSKLKRDPNVALADISFADGEMRYLGVRVAESDVATSELVIIEP